MSESKSMSLKIIRIIFSPLLSLFIFVLGSGLFMTLITLRLDEEHASSLAIGSMTAAFYIGLILASSRVEKNIAKVGHIRAFAGFASALAVISILQGIYVSTWFWLILRLLGGYATAGIFVVIESWLLSLGKIKTRGKILAFYMIVFYAAQSLGQLLLNISSPKTLLLFTLVSMLTSLSVIPVAMTRVVQPKIKQPSALNFRKLYKASGSGVIGSFTSGTVIGVIYGLLPLFLIEKTANTAEVSLLMSLTILGGMTLQYPIGRLSDVIDRRKVLVFVGSLTIIISLLTIFAFQKIWLATIGLFLFGGFTFTLYPISITQACDNLDPKDIVSGTQGLLLAYSIGAAVGPLIASLFIHYFGENGLFIYFVAISTLLIIYILWRSFYVSPTEREEPFISIPHTTPIASELDPRGEDVQNKVNNT